MNDKVTYIEWEDTWIWTSRFGDRLHTDTLDKLKAIVESYKKVCEQNE